jgi:ATP-dependent Clp protease ATP-binding subunit ClpC
MGIYRIPVLVWKDHEGFISAGPVEDDLSQHTLVAVDTTKAGALAQIKSWLNRHYKNDSSAFEPDFLDPKLSQIKVSVRPQYKIHDRAFPCDVPIELPVPCVIGHQASGGLVCSLPTLQRSFYLHADANVMRIVAERLRYELEGRTPEELSQMLPPASAELDVISVSFRNRIRRQRSEPELPTLSTVAQALGQPDFRKRFSAPWQREPELADLTARLRDEKANIVLVGEHGSGKSTLLVAAVRALERKSKDDAKTPADRPPPRARYRLWSTNAARLIAGMKYLGEWEERLEAVIEELSEIDGVFCVENLLDFLLVGGAGPGDSLAAFVLPYMQNGQLRVVGEATPEELDACRRLLPGFADMFQLLRVDEMSAGRARSALVQVAQSRTLNSKITVDEHVVELICRLFRRFMPYRALPGQAARFIDELFDQAKQQGLQQITPAQATERFIRETGLSDRLLQDDLPLPVEEVQQSLEERIIGQDTACQTMAELVATFKAGLNNPRRPIGALLFCGPTGVGKTELAKVVSEYLFGHGKNTDRLVRLDMSEYSSPWAAERLITKEDRTPSEFINRVRQLAFVVVVLDEIEKASPEVFDVLLGVLDEGRLTDRYGRTTTFKSAVIIMTSNIGASVQRSIGFDGESADDYESEARSFFRPEFFNRIDSVVTFSPLDRESCLAITRKELDEIQRREGLIKANLSLQFSDSLVEHLVEQGFDPRYGARPLQRTIETAVVSPLSRYLIENSGVKDRVLRLDVDAEGNCVIR